MPQPEQKIEITPRQAKITATAAKRQPDLRVVLENIHDPHNVSAILRTCDAVGVPLVSLVYTNEKFPHIGKKSSASAFKWVDREKFRSIKECYDSLHAQGISVYATTLVPGAKNIYDIDFTKPCALVLGNEHRGVSDEAAQLADACVYIPMQGMVQSLNVSVATAVALYEVLRQRLAHEMYSEIPTEKTAPLVQRYLRK
jgi:tRNA (guanosine-2'-O-)-methyltransferase